MARKRKKAKDGITEDEKLTIADVLSAFKQIAEFIDDEENELPSLSQLGFDAQVELLKGIHTILGDDKLHELKQILDMADDPDFRCPK